MVGKTKFKDRVLMNLAERDQSIIWHPFTQHYQSAIPIPIVRGEGAYLFDEKGNALLDLISSWWVNLHGHSHPEIAKAIYDQALTLEHVIFSNFTHEPAVLLADQILKLLPNHFKKVFYSDNGSTSVEIALKMAYQFWQNQGQIKKRRFLAFKNAYHGDTVGAMSVGKGSGFYSRFEDLFFPVDLFSYPETWINDSEIETKEQEVLLQLEQHLDQHREEIAALIIEPLIQGASGMRMCRPEFLQKMENLLKSYDILIIYDEVMTGFGRTGAYFSCLKAATAPDIICLSKGLSGGFLPLAMTVCTDKVYQAFLGDDFSTALAHGHSFTANPLGCAAGLASLKLLLDANTQQQISRIESVHSTNLSKLNPKRISHRRYCGTIAAFDLKFIDGYGSKNSIELRNRFLKRGLLIRPLGNVIYLLPPYCITENELINVYNVIAEEIEALEGVTC